MEFVSDINLNKQLVAILDNNSLKLWDIKKKLFIHSFNLQNISRFLFSQNHNYLVASDNNGKIYSLDIANLKVSLSSKIHDNQITSFCLSNTQNLVYSTSLDGSIKVTDFLTGELINVIKLNTQNTKTFKSANIVAIDNLDKNLLFTVKEKIKIKNLLKNKDIITVGSHASNITDISFCNDNKLFISLSNDNYINIWHIKNIGTPLIILQTNSICKYASLHFFSKGIYHAYCYNKNSIYTFKLNLSEISKEDNMKNVLPSNEITLQEKNLMNCKLMNNETNKIQSLFILYGTPFKVMTKTIKYAKNYVEFKESNIVINSALNQENNQTNQTKGDINNKNPKILNEVEMSNNEKVFNSFKDSEYKKLYDLISTETPHTEEKTNKISLINVIKTALINNDSSSLDWALDQKDTKTIENSVKSMDKDILLLFIPKMIEKFQSVNIMKKNFVLWIDYLFKHHFFTILSLPKETQTQLHSMQVLINSRTKNFIKLIEVRSKLESILTLFSNKNTQNTLNGINSHQEETPMLLYNESDSDEEKNKKYNLKLKKNKIKVASIDNVKKSQKKEQEIIDDKVEKEIDDEIEDIDEDDVDIEMGNNDDIGEFDEEGEEGDEYDDIGIDGELDDNDI